MPHCSYVFALRYWGKQEPVAIAALVAFVVGMAGLCVILRGAASTAAPVRDTVVECRQRGDDVMGYVTAYLVPFMGLDLSDGGQIIGLILFLFVFGYLYVTTSMIYVNPMLRGIGYRVYEVKLERNGFQRVITRRKYPWRPGDSLRVVRVGHELVIERSEDECEQTIVTVGATERLLQPRR